MSVLTLFRVRAIFGSIPGASSPPSVGGNIRSILINLDPERLRAYRLSPDDVVRTPAPAPATWSSLRGNARQPTTRPRWCRRTPWSSTRGRCAEHLPRDPVEHLYIRDLSTITDATDIDIGDRVRKGQ